MSSLIVWSKPSCVQCTATKRKFTKLGVDYEERDLTEYPEVLDEFVSKGYSSAPVVTLDDMPIFCGYDVDVIEQTFGR